MNDAGVPFLTGEWRSLALLNYEIDPSRLLPLAPRGTEIDAFQGRTWVSLVGFLFRRTRVLGLPIPLHRRFEEVNLRFYVRRRAEEGWRRGVVFVGELVPRRAVAAAACVLYNERYRRVAMSHRIQAQGGRPRAVSYAWTDRGRSYRIEADLGSDPAPASAVEIDQDFFAEHHWGYVSGRNGKTYEYRVEHPRWNCWRPRTARFEGDARALYGDALGDVLTAVPASALLADGSRIAVFWRRRLER